MEIKRNPSIDYKRMDYYWAKHHERYKNRVSNGNLTCQECRGDGGWKETILDDGSGPWFGCGYCEGTGRITPWLRGMWLKFKRQEKRNGNKT